MQSNIGKPKLKNRGTTVLQALKDRIRARRKLVGAVSIVAALSLVAVIAVAAATRSYSIIYGDTLGEIAAANNTDVDTLAKLNGIQDVDYIVSGDNLLIPVDDPATGPHNYVVQQGDTLRKIAERFNVSVDALISWNDLADGDLIVVGDELAVPEASAEYAADESSSPAEATPVPSSTEAPSAESTGQQSGASDQQPSQASAGDAPELHLVVAGETLNSIAEQYGISVDQIIAANALASKDFRAGMILKIPAMNEEGIQLLGMPTIVEPWPLVSEVAAVSLATSYWGQPLSTADILDALPQSENPHLGFRGNYQAEWGSTDNYGVYAEPLADIVNGAGFAADAFYADGDSTALTSRIDAGTPVVAWVTYKLEPQEREVVESDAGRYSLITGQHAVVVYGYDADSVLAVDVSDGSYVRYAWADFMDSWALFDGMGLAVSLP